MKSLKWFWLMVLATFTNNSFVLNGEEIAGFSWRKIAGLVALVTAVLLTFKNAEISTYLSTLYSWQLFVLLCVGLITVPQLLETLSSIKTNNPK